MRQRRAFTLIELLVVIAIIAILAGILFPVFAQARKRGEALACLSNVKQVGMGMLMYASDYHQKLPPYSHGAGYKGSLGYAGADGMRWADMLFSYTKNTLIFDCPTRDLPLATLSGGQWYDIRTYSHGYSSPSSGASECGPASRKLTRLPDPVGTVMITEDGREDSGSDLEALGRIIASPSDSMAALASRVDGMRHTDANPSEYSAFAMNTVFCDGHAKFTRLTDTYMKAWTIALD